jgi:hypothetical protein
MSTINYQPHAKDQHSTHWHYQPSKTAVTAMKGYDPQSGEQHPSFATKFQSSSGNTNIKSLI